MKKLLLVLLILAIASFLFSGCLPVTPSEDEGEGCVGTGLANGDFEMGDFSNWTVTVSDLFPQIQSYEVNSDNYAAHIGDGAWGVDAPLTDTASIQQTVAIPTCAVNPKLSFYYQAIGKDGSFCEMWDNMKFSVNDTEILCVWKDTDGWQQFDYSLNDYIGTSIILKISSWTRDPVVKVDYYVDDISITWD